MSPMPTDKTKWENEASSSIVQVAPEEGVRNLTKLILANKFVIWFSFRTPIAYSEDGMINESIMTRKRYSTTTSAHMAFLRGSQSVIEIPHGEFIAGLLEIMQDGVATATEASA